EWTREDLPQRIAAAKHLRAALGVVHGEAERLRDEGRAEAAEVVARGLPADLAAEQAHARAEHHGDLRPRREDLHERRQLGERSGQIGVPEAGDFRAALERRDDPAPHRLRLAAVALEVE